MLGLALISMCLIRWRFQLPYELDPDTSAWMSGAISTARSDTPLWTLFNDTDSRPLTVLPLALVELMGFRLTWPMTDGIGVALWTLSILFLFGSFRLYFSEKRSFWLVLPLILFHAGHVWPGFMSYNSEHVCILMLTVGTWGVLRLAQKPVSVFSSFLLGCWLGLLPFAKLQAVPMGLGLAAFAAWILYQQKSWKPLIALGLGGFLPLIGVLSMYASRQEVDSFWNDYFWNYYYYSFTQVYSSAEVPSRFGWRPIAKAFLQIPATRFFWGSWSLVMLLGSYFFFRKRHPAPFPTAVLWLALSQLVLSIYAVLQAGNPFDHYRLFLVVPSVLGAGLIFQFVPKSWANLLGISLLVVILGEATKNWMTFAYPPTLPLSATDARLSTMLQKHAQPSDKLSIWGYADRFFVLTHLPAGNRLPHAYWIYTQSPLQAYRQRQFLDDLEKRKTTLIWDAMTPTVPLPHYEPKIPPRHNAYPAIRQYVEKNYTLIDTLYGTWLYRRKANL